jgi:hypothetical protein
MAGAAAGFGILFYLNVLLQRVIDKTRPAAAHDVAGLTRWLKVMSVVMGLSIFGVALWIAHFSWRVNSTAVYPPPGSRHIKPRQVLRGARARWLALMGYVLAATLALVGCALIAGVWRLLRAAAGP